MEKFQITAQGYKKLKAQLEKLKNEDRPNVFKQIATARELGDLRENSEYHSAKDGIVERINEDGVEVKSTLHIGFGDSILKGGLILFILISLHGISLIIKNLNRIKLISNEQFVGLAFLITFLLFRLIEGGLTPGSIFNAVLFGMSLGILENNKDIRIK